MKTPTAKYFAAIMALSKQFPIDYLLESLLNSEGHRPTCLSLEVVMNTFILFPLQIVVTMSRVPSDFLDVK